MGQKIVCRKTVKEYYVVRGWDGRWHRLCSISHYELRSRKGWLKSGLTETHAETASVRPSGWQNEQLVTFQPR